MRKIIYMLWVLITVFSFLSEEKLEAAMERFIIPMSKVSPKIDGVFSRGEWDEAVGITGFLSSIDKGDKGFTQRQSVGYLTYDNQRLYIAVRSPIIPSGGKLVAKENKRDQMMVTSDDVIEFCIKTLKQDAGYYYFIGNSMGNIYDDWRNPEIGQRLLNWNGKWEFKNNVDSFFWTAEVAIPLKELNINKISDGETWETNITRTWQYPTECTCLLWGPHQGVKCTFFKDAPAIQVVSLGDLRKGKLNLKIKTKGKEKIKISTSIEADKKVVFKKEDQISCGEEYSLSSSFSAAKKNVFYLKITSLDEKRVYYEQCSPFYPYDRSLENLIARRPKQISSELRFNIAYLPTYHRVKTLLDISGFGKKVHSFKIILYSERGDVIAKKTGDFSGESEIDACLEFEKLPEGNYEVEASVYDKTGQLVATGKKGFLRKYFPWEGNNVGKSNIVIPPWTPMEAKNDKFETEVDCWGRRYFLNNSGLFQKVIVFEKNILAGPISLTGRLDGKEEVLKTKEGPKIVEALPHQVNWEGEGSLGNLKIRIKGKAEYDGFVLFEMELTPKDKVKVESLIMKIPYKKEYAELMHACGESIRNNTSGAIPEGEGVIWDSSAVPTPNLYGHFIPYVWLGKEKGGLCWFAESDEGWMIKDDIAPIEVQREGNKVSLLIHFINQDGVIDKKRKIVFGFQATPVKPLVPEKRRFARSWGPRAKVGKSDGIGLKGYYPENFDYELYEKEFRRLFSKYNLDAMSQYCCKSTLPTVQPEWKVYKGEWGGLFPPQPFARSGGSSYPKEKDEKNYYVAVPYSPSLVDMKVYYVVEWAKKTHGIFNTYWDNLYLKTSDRIEIGRGYVRDDGKLQPTFDLLLTRELIKRLAVGYYEAGLKPYTWVHSTNGVYAPVLSFADHLYTFEMKYPVKTKDGWKDYIATRSPIDVLRSEGTPKLLGIWVTPLPPQARGSGQYRQWGRDPFILRSFIALDLLAGTGHNEELGFGKPRWESKRRIARIFTDKFGSSLPFFKGDASFYGYWEVQDKIQPDVEDFKVSYYENDKGIMLVVVNIGEKRLSKNVWLNLQALGIKGIKKIEDPENLDDLRPCLGRRLEGMTPLRIFVPRHDFKLVWLEYK